MIRLLKLSTNKDEKLSSEDILSIHLGYFLTHGKRLFVHLSQTKEIAYEVGSRHGSPYILEVNCEKMIEDGIKFYLSRNGVWLTKYVDVKYIKV